MLNENILSLLTHIFLPNFEAEDITAAVAGYGHGTTIIWVYCPGCSWALIQIGIDGRGWAAMASWGDGAMARVPHLGYLTGYLAMRPMCLVILMMMCVTANGVYVYV